MLRRSCCHFIFVFNKISPGCDIDVKDLVYEPPRDGPTLWEIGIPDRSAAEFYVPDPNPNYINPVLANLADRYINPSDSNL